MSEEFDILAMYDAMDDSPITREMYIRAPFGFPGSKFRSLDQILPLLPHDDVYVEPFGGSGSVLLSRRKSALEVFNDRYAGVVAFYRCLRDKKDQLVDRLSLCLHAREEFIWCKDTWRDCTDDVERAARWYYMVRMSFGQIGLIFGRCTGSKGNMGLRLHNSLELFHPVHERLKHVQIENQDWRDCIKDYDSLDTVFYMDPPYLECQNKYEHSFTEAHHIELCERIQDIKGFVALSGFDNSVYDRYPWDAKYSWSVQGKILGLAFTEENHMAGKEGTVERQPQEEVLWIREAKR